MVGRCSCVRGVTWFRNVIKSGGFLSTPGRTFRALTLTFRSVWYLRKWCGTPWVPPLGIGMMLLLTRCSQATVLLGLHPLHFSCCEVKTVRVFLFSITDWSGSDVLCSSYQWFWNSTIVCSEPGKLVIGSHVSCLSREKSHHTMRNSTSFFVIRLPAAPSPCFFSLFS
jgi:hypothetical protein